MSDYLSTMLLTKKKEIDCVIRDAIDKVLVLRFGRASDPVCLHLDDIVWSPSPLLLALRSLSLFLSLTHTHKLNYCFQVAVIEISSWCFKICNNSLGRHWFGGCSSLRQLFWHNFGSFYCFLLQRSSYENGFWVQFPPSL